MIEISKIEIFNFEGALRGMRNPKDSWDLSDSKKCKNMDCQDCNFQNSFCSSTDFIIGEKDMKLCQGLIKGGPEHRKFLRQIFVSMDINAPLYWWKEMDTYKVATTSNSCSTMHKLHSNPITFDKFSLDNGYMLDGVQEVWYENFFEFLENLRTEYNMTGNLEAWRLLIQLLPSSWNQKRTWTCSYETLFNICNQRPNHKLREWRHFIEVIKTIPYGKEFLIR